MKIRPDRRAPDWAANCYRQVGLAMVNLQVSPPLGSHRKVDEPRRIVIALPASRYRYSSRVRSRMAFA